MPAFAEIAWKICLTCGYRPRREAAEVSEVVVKVAVERRWQQRHLPPGMIDGPVRAPSAARDAGVDEEAALRLDVGGAPDRVGEERVAAVDEDVARLGVRQHRLDELVDRRLATRA